MHRSTIVATAVAFAGSAAAQLLGEAIVVNSCSYPVYLQNTPSADGGFEPISQTLQTGDKYSQLWTELTNGNGWSLKLSQDEGSFESNVMQYEYTWHGWEGAWGGVIWYDLSDVNGNPWDGNWELTATGQCTPRQAAYQYSTDDAYGMQSCPGGSSITVELCSGDASSGSGSGSGSGSSSGSSPSSSADSSSSTTAAPASSSADAGPFSPAVEGGNIVNGVNNQADKKHKHKPSPSPTTLATSVTSAVNRGGVTVTNIATEVITNFVTATAGAPLAAAKRHEHVARHAHHHHH